MFNFKDIFGRSVSPYKAIFPILTGNQSSNEFKFHGTGFFINTWGGFITAKHVLYNNDGSLINPFFAITTHNSQRYIRYLHSAYPHPVADICFGVLQKKAILNDQIVNVDFKTTVLQVLENEVQSGEMIRTFAYPNSIMENRNEEQFGNVRGDWYDGKIQDILPYRDKTFYPYQIIQSNMLIKSGASGGPVLKKGYVVGVNSSGYDELQNEEPLSFITPIKFALEIEITLDNETFTLGSKKIQSIVQQ